MNYFAVEIQEESDSALTEHVIRTSNLLGLRYTKIEVLGRFTLGATKFLRFRTKEDGIPRLLNRLHEQGLAVIGTEGAEFAARLRGRRGICPATLMLATSVSPLAFRGPGAQYWDRQFQVPD